MKFEDFLYKYKMPVVGVLIGLILIFSSYFFSSQEKDTNNLVVSETDASEQIEIVVEISGAVKKPGVYKLSSGSRVEDLVLMAGGFENENTDFVSKTINRAAILKDGQKLYIPTVDEQIAGVSASNSGGYSGTTPDSLSSPSGLININSASKSQLESLNGIGPVYAQNIIDHRPYSDISELKDKGVLKSATYEKIKSQISVF